MSEGMSSYQDHDPRKPFPDHTDNHEVAVESTGRMVKKLSKVFDDIKRENCECHCGADGSTSPALLGPVADRATEKYGNSTVIQKAFPERSCALLLTLALEIPVAFLIVSGGNICDLIGMEKYQLLLAFLPITSAISGNVGLQCSSLTTRAISHSKITWETFPRWLGSEMLVSLCLAALMGLVLGLVSVAWTAADNDIGKADWGFGLTIAISQAISIIVAGLTGTFAPIIFNFLFKRDSGKWAGPLETAVQDIAGAFAMTFIAAGVLRLCIQMGITPAADVVCPMNS